MCLWSCIPISLNRNEPSTSVRPDVPHLPPSITTETLRNIFATKYATRLLFVSTGGQHWDCIYHCVPKFSILNVHHIPHQILIFLHLFPLHLRPSIYRHSHAVGSYSLIHFHSPICSTKVYYFPFQSRSIHSTLDILKLKVQSTCTYPLESSQIHFESTIIYK